MRSILTLSLPAAVVKAIQKQARAMGLSVSEFMRRIWEFQGSLITEEDLVQRRDEAIMNQRAGRVKILRSFRDLDR